MANLLVYCTRPRPPPHFGDSGLYLFLCYEDSNTNVINGGRLSGYVCGVWQRKKEIRYSNAFARAGVYFVILDDGWNVRLFIFLSRFMRVDHNETNILRPPPSRLQALSFIFIHFLLDTACVRRHRYYCGKSVLRNVPLMTNDKKYKYNIGRPQ